MPQERILVVQDEGIVADDIRQSLGRLGYIVDSVPLGEAAVQSAACSDSIWCCWMWCCQARWTG